MFLNEVYQRRMDVYMFLIYLAQVASSLRSSNRRPTAYSRKGSRGVTVSTSRATAARAAAILLVSCHIRDEELNRKLSTGTYKLVFNTNFNQF